MISPFVPACCCGNDAIRLILMPNAASAVSPIYVARKAAASQQKAKLLTIFGPAGV
jgi:hypothetical protein